MFFKTHFLLPESDIVEIQSIFAKHRATLPLMFIATPGDLSSKQWTSRIEEFKPSTNEDPVNKRSANHTPAQILHRVAVLAVESIKVLENQLMRNSVISAKSDYKVLGFNYYYLVTC